MPPSRPAQPEEEIEHRVEQMLTAERNHRRRVQQLVDEGAQLSCRRHHAAAHTPARCDGRSSLTSSRVHRSTSILLPWRAAAEDGDPEPISICPCEMIRNRPQPQCET
eukprot:5034027-Prymnesium_polylepis.1